VATTLVRLRISGEDEAVALAARLDAAGDGRLRRSLRDAIKDANRDVPSRLRASAIATLPKRGGLAGEVARSRIRTYELTAGASVGVTIRASHRYDIEGMDKGATVHPLFGNKRHWYWQRVRGGWFSDVVDDQKARNHRAIVQAVESFDI
jgi:hypothetical protein